MTSHPVSPTTTSLIRDILMSVSPKTKLAVKLALTTALISSNSLFGNHVLGAAQAQTTAQSTDQSLVQTPTQPPEATPTEPQATQAGVIEPPAAPTPKPTPFTPSLAGVLDLSTQAETGMVGIGHLRPQDTVTADGDGDAVSWLEDIILPLYISPDGEHWGWLYQGWLVPGGQTYLAIGRDAGFAMVKSGENLYTFPVLDIREDGWFQVQYTTGGSAWAHTSQLSLGETTMVLENWEETLSEQTAVYFLNDTEAQPLRSQPEAANNMLGLVSTDSLIEPLDFAGDWMRVRVTRPAADCTPLTGATVTEGWMRWRSDESKSLVWYQPDGSCLPS